MVYIFIFIFQNVIFFYCFLWLWWSEKITTQNCINALYIPFCAKYYWKKYVYTSSLANYGMSTTIDWSPIAVNGYNSIAERNGSLLRQIGSSHSWIERNRLIQACINYGIFITFIQLNITKNNIPVNLMAIKTGWNLFLIFNFLILLC